ncbi:MarR family transcriptional regulator [uncultured Zoogloea sp.]|uniref:HVO_A0114 family putative DNA-binding protein n=1 Tax=uncultured Zoogloea sp. TaxID=160237 RepID=UPI0026108B9D|nr:MarR family transcriptional regulator [uncultured Zoogloea sp.]
MANCAIIGVSDWSKARDGLLALADALEAGKVGEPADYRLNFASAAQLLSELPPRRLDTLREVKRAGPVSIYAVAKALLRNYSNVHADVQKLIEHGLIEKDEGGRVFVPWDDVVVRVDASLLQAA